MAAPASEAAKAARVFTVPAGEPFLDALARAVLAGDIPAAGGARPSPIELSRMTLLLPTRHGLRAVQDAFLKASGTAALLLPQIRSVDEGQEEFDLIAASSSLFGDGAAALALAAPISDIERQITLTQLVMRWSQVMREGVAGDDEKGALYAAAGARTPAQAVKLAGELARLVDLVETEDASLSRLAELVPDAFSEHWGRTLEFLRIITDYWPACLAERGLLSAVDRRNRLIQAEAKGYAERPPASPVIAAGVLGSIPATAELMTAVAGLASGAIILPSLDRDLDDASWTAIIERHPEHPQYALAKILAAIGVDRRMVRDLPGLTPRPLLGARRRLVNEAMRPAESTEQWHVFSRDCDRDELRLALANVALIEAPGAEDEAEVVALILREAIETPGQTAALISPDRILARRVVAKMRACGVVVDDAAGRPFNKTVPGVFLDLIVEVVASAFAPVALVALLKHPLMRLGLAAGDVRRAGRILEIAAFRTPYLGRGIDGVEMALERAARDVGDGDRRGQAVSRFGEAQWQLARRLVALLRHAFAPLALPEPEPPSTLKGLARAHLDAAEALARLPDGDTSNPLLESEAGLALTEFFDGLLDPATPDLAVGLTDYPDFFRSLIAGRNVRQRAPGHPRISILGPMDARLRQTDIVILGSLNENSWPAAADPGPWLNRPMRQSIGLPAPEAAIGRSAHDFVSGFCAGRVYLTRAAKVDGVPTVPSRWLMRLQALLGGMELGDALDADRPWLAWARARDQSGPRRPSRAPEPTPPVKLRPRRLSVTEIETWMANPYAIFARHVLGLEHLTPLGAEPDAALKGAIVHAALGRFASQYPTNLPPDIAAELMRHARAVLADYAAHPRVAAFWVPRFERFAEWFATAEAVLRRGVTRVAGEVTGSLVLAGPAGPFTLRARADRIDIASDGLAIIDYKTGQPPRTERVESGASPQLPLEAAIAVGGGFPGIPAGAVSRLSYILVTGGQPPGEAKALKIADIPAVTQHAVAGLERLIALYDDAATPYSAVRRARFADSYRFDDFAHLARVAEWMAETGSED